MILDVDGLDLIKAISWREELHKRDSKGRFAKQAAPKQIRKGSKVVAKNGAEGKVSEVTDTHYHIEKTDGKTSKVLKHNVLHADEHKELTKTKGAKKKDANTTRKTTPKAEPKKSTSKTVPKPKKTTTGSGRGGTVKPKPSATPPVPKAGAKEPGGKKSREKKDVNARFVVVRKADKDEGTPIPKKPTATAIRKGSSVHTSTGRIGKVAGQSEDGTKWLIDTDDGKKIRVNKTNVTHAKDVKASKTVGGTGNAPSKPTSKTKTTKQVKEPTTTKKGAGADAKTKPKGNGKPVQKTGKTKTSEGGTKDKPTTTKRPGGKGIRSEVQKNRELAYDVGEKIGGARKDLYESNFKEKPTLQNLAALEKDSGAVAQKMVTKKNVLPALDLAQERANGVELPTAIMKKLIQDRIAPKPLEDTPEARQSYVAAINTLVRHFEGIKTWDNMRGAINEFRDLASAGGQRLRNATRYLESERAKSNPKDREYFGAMRDKGLAAKAMMNFDPLGDKVVGFFTNFDKLQSSMKTVNKHAAGGWDTYLAPKEAPTKTKGPGGKDVNKRWERKAEAEHLRIGGKATKVEKPEDLIKEFGVRGVEFGHWVNDTSGKYHLKRCAEAFDDLSDVLGINPKDISLNKRLSIAFGARGKGGALAHYEPARKVINMTKHGGAGSLAHEWGHAMDNILSQYSNGSVESMNLASNDGGLGDHDPKLKTLYDNLMSRIKNPVPGQPGVFDKVQVSSDDPSLRSYSPAVVRVLKEAASEEEGIQTVIANWQQTDYRKKQQISTLFSMAQAETNQASRKGIEKRMQKAIRERKKAKDDVPKHIAYGMYMNNGRKEHWSGTIEMPVGTSEYMHRMSSLDGGNVGKYWSENAEMFARVFEGYVQHKLDKDKRYNNYLVHGTREADVIQGEAPFPIGKEREHMFKAMENLMAHVTKGKALEKALEMELRKGNILDELENIPEGNRNAYRVSHDVPPGEILYIPLNRLRLVHQTDQATNPAKVVENINKMHAGEALAPVVIGHDYDILDGHHRWEASDSMGYTHVPCVVMRGTNEVQRRRAIEGYQELWKSFDESKVKRDEQGRFSTVYHITKEADFKHDPEHKNSGQEWGAGFYTAPADDVDYWHRALRDKASGEAHPYIRQLDVSEARLLHTKDVPSSHHRADVLMEHYGGGEEALEAIEKEEMEHVTGETYGMRPHEIAEYRLYARLHGYDGLIAHDEKEGHQVVLFDDSKVKYGDTMGIDDFLKKKRWGEL